MSKRPLRILTLAAVPPDPDSGAAGTVYHTNVALRELGHKVDEIWADDLGLRRIGHGNLHSLLEQPWAYRDAVRRAAKKKTYDVVQMSQPQAYLAARDLKGRGFKGLVINRSHGVELRVNAVLSEWHRKLGVRASRFPRSLLTPVLRRLLERQWPAVARWSDGIIVQCEDDRDCLLERLRLDPNRVRAILNGVPDDYLTPSPPMTVERLRRLLYVGQFAFFKAPQILAEVFNRVLLAHPECTATWMTSTASVSDVQHRLDPDVRGRVRVRGWVRQRELRDVYDEHGIFVFPSLFEGTGKACLEAMARGLSVVAADTSGMRDYITNGKDGILCSVGDVEGMVSAVSSQLAAPSCAARISSRAARVASHYSWRRCAGHMVAFYLERANTASLSDLSVSQETPLPRRDPNVSAATT